MVTLNALQRPRLLYPAPLPGLGNPALISGLQLSRGRGQRLWAADCSRAPPQAQAQAPAPAPAPAAAFLTDPTLTHSESSRRHLLTGPARSGPGVSKGKTRRFSARRQQGPPGSRLRAGAPPHRPREGGGSWGHRKIPE
ncbi:hypothetical protein chiPu_0018688 [Chiloscyllium punctatum]|uniref:Uncharacterized protein n=1 Tax=Chiloscyllium punctatum TaxID=137246 RepID=A0A401RPI6_CHIPU|nr:hypothetical protein [Chiloscyllium punctatum]